METGDGDSEQGGYRPATRLRRVTAGDVPILYEHQRDGEAARLAAVTPRDREAHAAHWGRVLADPRVVARAVEDADGVLVGHAVVFEQDGERLVGYWIGRAHWGRGHATEAVRLLLRLVPERPLAARVAVENLASVRVLEKCGFRRVASRTAFDRALGRDVSEALYRLDVREPPAPRPPEPTPAPVRRPAPDPRSEGLRRVHARPDGSGTSSAGGRHPRAVRCGDVAWIGGQIDGSPAGALAHADLDGQTAGAVAGVARALADVGCDLTDLVKLLCFYVADGGADDAAMLAALVAALPADVRPAVTLVPVPYLAHPGAVVEIEGYAMRGADGTPLPRTVSTAGPPPSASGFPGAVRCGRMLFLGAQAAVDDGRVLSPGDIIGQTSEVMGRLGAVLDGFGASFADVVKLNRWYLGTGTVEDFEPAALACAAHFPEPGPAATGIPVPAFPRAGQAVQIELVAMLGEDGSHLPRRHVWPESVWDWTVHLPYKHGLKCHDMVFLGGQVSLDRHGRAVHPGDMVRQTHQAMEHIGTILRDLGVDYADVCKVTTVYQGPAGTEALDENLEIRSSYFPEPGPATTGIPLPVLAYPDMIIEIDVFAMAEPDPA